MVKLCQTHAVCFKGLYVLRATPGGGGLALGGEAASSAAPRQENPVFLCPQCLRPQHTNHTKKDPRRDKKEGKTEKKKQEFRLELTGTQKSTVTEQGCNSMDLLKTNPQIFWDQKIFSALQVLLTLGILVIFHLLSIL